MILCHSYLLTENNASLTLLYVDILIQNTKYVQMIKHGICHIFNKCSETFGQFNLLKIEITLKFQNLYFAKNHLYRKCYIIKNKI